MSKTCVENLLAHWDTLSPVAIPPLEFYSLVEDALAEQNLPGLVISRVWWHQGNWLSERRQYLRVRRQKLAFDICAMPLGNSFHVSWWLTELAPGPMGLFFELPLFGPALERMISPVTFYQVDTTVHFQRSIHEAVLKVIDVMNKRCGFRQPLHQPIMPDFYE